MVICISLLSFQTCLTSFIELLLNESQWGPKPDLYILFFAPQKRESKVIKFDMTWGWVNFRQNFHLRNFFILNMISDTASLLQDTVNKCVSPALEWEFAGCSWHTNTFNSRALAAVVQTKQNLHLQPRGGEKEREQKTAWGKEGAESRKQE